MTAESIDYRRQAFTAKPKETIVVLGTGDLGRALVKCLTSRGYKAVVASRNPDKNRLRIESVGGMIEGYVKALSKGQLVIAAIPLEGFAHLPADLLKEKIVIDVSNKPLKYKGDDPSLAFKLQTLLPDSRVVKAFNTLSAYGLQNNLLQGSKEVPVCSDDEEAKLLVMALVRNLGFMPVDRGTLSSAADIEKITLAFFPEWRLAGKLALVIYTSAFLIQLFRFQICPMINYGSWEWYVFSSILLGNVHTSCALTAITLLTSCYLPGVIAAYIQLHRGTKYSEFPKWLDNWLLSRKQIGIFTQFFATMHVFMVSFILMMGNIEPSWRVFTFIAFGAFGLALITMLSISSLPSVSQSLTWREFSFIQRYFGWSALTCILLHLIFKEWSILITNNQSCIVIPHPAQIVIILPLITVLLKIVLVLPCVDIQLQKIRQGYDRNLITDNPA